MSTWDHSPKKTKPSCLPDPSRFATTKLSTNATGRLNNSTSTCSIDASSLWFTNRRHLWNLMPETWASVGSLALRIKFPTAGDGSCKLWTRKTCAGRVTTGCTLCTSGMKRLGSTTTEITSAWTCRPKRRWSTQFGGTTSRRTWTTQMCRCCSQLRLSGSQDRLWKCSTSLTQSTKGSCLPLTI